MTAFEKLWQEIDKHGNRHPGDKLEMTRVWNTALDTAQSLSYESSSMKFWSYRIVKNSDIEKLKQI